LRPTASNALLLIDRACEKTFADQLRALDPTWVDVQRLPEVALKGAVLLLRTHPSLESESLRTLRCIRRQSPFIVILLAAHWNEVSHLRLNRYVRAGGDDLVTFGAADGASSAEYVALRLRTPPPREELAELDRRYSRSASLAAVSHGIRNGSIHLTAAQLARRFGYAARTLREHLATAGFPCPRDVVRCGWFLNLAELRAHEPTSAEEVARLLGFADATDLRKKKSQFRASIAADGRLATFVSAFPRLVAIVARNREPIAHE